LPAPHDAQRKAGREHVAIYPLDRFHHLACFDVANQSISQ